MRQTGIYPECTTASVQPHLTSAVNVCQSAPAVAGVDHQETKKHISLQRQGWQTLGAQSTRKRGWRRLKSLRFHPLCFPDEDDSQLHANSAPKDVKDVVTSLLFCESVPSIPRSSYPSADKNASSFIYRKHLSVLSSLCISHVGKPKSHILQTCRKSWPGRFK